MVNKVLTVMLLVILAIGLATKGYAKPDKKPRLKCDYDGICDPGEKEDCPDCQGGGEPTALQLDHSGVQIASGSGADDKKLYHIKYMEGAYKNTWNSSVNDGFTHATSIGDVDNDQNKEITTVVNYRKTGGPPSQRVSYQKIFVYEDGSAGDPNYTSHDLGYSTNGVRDSIIADADNDGQNEIVLVEEKHIEIYKWNGTGFTNLWNSIDYDYFIWSVDVGDADNDGDNEVVLAMFSMGSAIVYEYLGSSTWGDPTTTESIGSCNIDYAKVRDTDNDNYNEIVGGGTSNKLNVWEYTNGSYENVFLSDDLGGFTQGIDAGDVDGDGNNELIAGTSGGVNKIYVFKYNQGTATYENVDSVSCTSGVQMLSTGDLDNDNKDEIAAYVSGITIFEYAPNLQSTYNFQYGGYLEIG